MEGFGALVLGYARLREVVPAMDAVKRFHSMGGAPDVQMLDVLVNLAVRTGDLKVAMQVRPRSHARKGLLKDAIALNSCTAALSAGVGAEGGPPGARAAGCPRDGAAGG